MMDEEREWLDLSKVALGAEVAILCVIAKSLKDVDESTGYDDAMAMQTAGMADVAAIAATLSVMVGKRAKKALDKGAEGIDSWAEPAFKASGRKRVLVKDSPFAAQSMESGKSKAARDAASMCRTSVLRIVAPDGSSKPIAQAYRECLSQAVTDVNVLEGSYTDSIDRMLRKMARYGVRVQYESGATRELYSAISMNVMDNYRMATQEARNEVGRAFGADGVEVSAHGMCAQDHLPYQGRVFSNEAFAKVQASLERPIAQGMNCRHQTFPILLGVSKPTHSAAQLNRYREQSEREVTVDGKTMTAYEFTQRQRGMETAIRKMKAERMVLSEGGCDTADVDARISSALNRYVAESKAAGVETREERTAVYEWTS